MRRLMHHPCHTLILQPTLGYQRLGCGLAGKSGMTVGKTCRHWRCAPFPELEEYMDLAGRMPAHQAMVESLSMRPFSRLSLALLLIAACQTPLAADSVAIRRAVEAFLQTQIKDLPGNPIPVIGRIDADRLPGACEGPTVSMNGPRRWGSTQVVVACRDDTRKLFVQVDIPVVAEYLVVARPVGAGQKLTDSDVNAVRGRLPNDALMDKNQVVGRIVKNSLGVGVPLRTDMFRQPWVVQQGQTVRIVVVGTGFEVTKEGRALHNSAVGQDTQVRVDSSTIVTGVARADGSVELRN